MDLFYFSLLLANHTIFVGKKNATLVFGVDINHCEDLAQTFNSNNICALALHSRVSSDTREKAVHDFKNGKIPVLINCGNYKENRNFTNYLYIFLNTFFFFFLTSYFFLLLLFPQVYLQKEQICLLLTQSYSQDPH